MPTPNLYVTDSLTEGVLPVDVMQDMETQDTELPLSMKQQMASTRFRERLDISVHSYGYDPYSMDPRANEDAMIARLDGEGEEPVNGYPHLQPATPTIQRISFEDQTEDDSEEEMSESGILLSNAEVGKPNRKAKEDRRVPGDRQLPAVIRSKKRHYGRRKIAS